MIVHSTILLVDDDPDIVLAASLRLKAAGYDTLTAHNGQAGVASAVASLPNAVVLDVRMPVQDGLSALSELKRRDDTKKIPVIMLSASIGDQQAALDAGAKFFLRKPYRGEDLVQAVDCAVSGPCEEVSGQRADGSLCHAADNPWAAEPTSDSQMSGNLRKLVAICREAKREKEALTAGPGLAANKHEL
jgi:CheY-like chemotaxis protein